MCDCVDGCACVRACVCVFNKHYEQLINKIKVSKHYHCTYFTDPLKAPHIIVYKVTNSTVEYRVQRNDGITNDPLITGYKVTRFGVLMIGEYVNTGRGRRVTISPAVPGAQYRITAWALGDGRRSAAPAVVDATLGASECIRKL